MSQLHKTLGVDVNTISVLRGYIDSIRQRTEGFIYKDQHTGERHMELHSDAQREFLNILSTLLERVEIASTKHGNPSTILIEVSGGLVSEVSTNNPDIEILLIDHDDRDYGNDAVSEIGNISYAPKICTEVELRHIIDAFIK